MCGVIGFFNFENSVSLVRKGLDLMSHRGVDGFSLFDGVSVGENISGNSFNCVGHRLHAVNGFSLMPLVKDGFVLSANCEIYNFRDLAKNFDISLHDNDSVVLLDFLIKQGVSVDSLSLLDGVYAFAFWDLNKNLVTITRDLLGEKPLWYFFHEGKFAFASEKKVLIGLGLDSQFIREVHPRHIITFDLSSYELSSSYKDFFEVSVLDEDDAFFFNETSRLLEDAVKKRIPPDNRVALLFSGGLDSCFIALILKKLGVDFKCYTASLEHDSFQVSHDESWSLRAAKVLGLDLEVVRTSLDDYKDVVKDVLGIIEDNNVTKVSVGASFFMCSRKARDDGFKVIFSGLGSEELFAGYNRHLNSFELNEECLSGFRKLFERDLYRDDVITMFNNLELRSPFLDINLVKFSLCIPPHLKLRDGVNKFILRSISKDLGLPDEFAFRRKMAAQYGSNFDKALTKFSKVAGLSKSGFLKQFYDFGNVRLGALWSTGKDSCLAVQIMLEQNYVVSCFITINPADKDSYMYHGPNTHLASLHSDACGIPLIVQDSDKAKEDELVDLRLALIRAVNEHNIEGVVSGALFSNYQRKRIEVICDELGLKVFAPLWHMDQEKELEILCVKNIDFCLVKVAAEGLDKSWLGRSLVKQDFDNLRILKEKFGLNPAGEGGEFESLVLDAPFFSKRISLDEVRVDEESELYASLVVVRASLVDKAFK
ncbi:diphthine--ammonia ligase [Candidatus Woesearchaeota archaeon]|nr:diphthine--ammonia ligase [Candidatus Woesearchaeota archaeon]